MDPTVFKPVITTKPEGRERGLAVGLGILRQHYGAILIESQVGKGAAMRVFFPLPPPARLPKAHATAART